MASGYQPKKMVKQKLYGHALFRPQPTNLDSIRCSLGFHDEVSFDLPPGVQSSSLFNEPPTYCTRCWHRGGGSLIPPRPEVTQHKRTAREELKRVQSQISELRKFELDLLKIIAQSDYVGGETPANKPTPPKGIREVRDGWPSAPEPRKIRNGSPPKAE